MESTKPEFKAQDPIVVSTEATPAQENQPGNDDGKRHPPLLAKLFAVFLISCISFGSRWSSGVTGAMKSTIKKVCTLVMKHNEEKVLTDAANEHLKHPILPPRSK